MNLQTNRNRHTVQLFSHAPADAAIFPCFHLRQLLNSLQCLIHWSITEKHFEKHHIKIEGYCTCRWLCGTKLIIWGWPSINGDSVRAKTLEKEWFPGDQHKSSCDRHLFVCTLIYIHVSANLCALFFFFFGNTKTGKAWNMSALQDHTLAVLLTAAHTQTGGSSLYRLEAPLPNTIHHQSEVIKIHTAHLAIRPCQIKTQRV